MTEKQKEKLAAHVAWNKPRGFSGNNLYYLMEGEIVSFTACEYTASNAQYEINNSSNRKLWYSQLANFYFFEDMEQVYNPIIQFKDGSSYVIAKSFDESEFYNRVRNKRFKVAIVSDAPYIFNDKSSLWNEKKLITHLDAYNYIKKCIANDCITDIGDLLKTSNAYFLTEV